MSISPSHNLQRARVRRPLAIAGLLALSAALLVPSLAAASARTEFTLRGDTLTASLTGGSRVGVWRIRIVAPSATKRIDFVLRSGDIAWSGAVRVSHRVGGRWTLVSKRQLGGTLTRLERASGKGAGVRWDTRNFRLPRNGDGRFAVTVELTRKGSYRVVGAVRVAREAFSFGSWTKVDGGVIAH